MIQTIKTRSAGSPTKKKNAGKHIAFEIHRHCSKRAAGQHPFNAPPKKKTSNYLGERLFPPFAQNCYGNVVAPDVDEQKHDGWDERVTLGGDFGISERFSLYMCISKKN